MTTLLCFQDLLGDVDVTGVDAVSEQVLCAALTAAEVTVVEELTVGHRETENQETDLKLPIILLSEQLVTYAASKIEYCQTI